METIGLLLTGVVLGLVIGAAFTAVLGDLLLRGSTVTSLRTTTIIESMATENQIFTHTIRSTVTSMAKETVENTTAMAAPMYQVTVTKTRVRSQTVKVRKLYYECYGGVGLFDRGIHVIAMDDDPLEANATFVTSNEFFACLKRCKTNTVKSDQVILLLISRGPRRTGGFSMRIGDVEVGEDSVGMKADFMDPAKGLVVTQALTNPIALISLGRFPSGSYRVTLSIDRHLATASPEGTTTTTKVGAMEWTASFEAID